MSFGSFWRRNLAFFRLAIQTNLEYRLNYFTDAFLQPSVTSLIEVTLWLSLFRSGANTQINGFGLEAYLAYAIWGAFLARITTTWMYEFRMIEEIDSGSINSLLVRPLSFFEYYMSQFFGYKMVTTGVSLIIPSLVCVIMKLPVQWDRVPGALCLALYYLIFVQTLSFTVATTAFHLNRVHSLTAAKNLALWLLSGELVPLDLFPVAFKNVLLWLPFSNAVYVPVAYLTGRVGPDVFAQGWLTTTLALIVISPISYFAWKKGLAKYAGTGA